MTTLFLLHAVILACLVLIPTPKIKTKFFQRSFYNKMAHIIQWGFVNFFGLSSEKNQRNEKRKFHYSLPPEEKLLKKPLLKTHSYKTIS